MSRTVERYQNPTCGDTINLRLFTYNSNNLKDIQAIEKVEIYFLDPAQVTADNPQGKQLIEIIEGDDITQESTGKYLLPLITNNTDYSVGNYLDVWHVAFVEGACGSSQIENPFKIYSDLWFTTVIPPVYDFSFVARPNKIVKGSKRPLIIQIVPNVPRGSDVLPYYENLAIVADLRVSIEMSCGECVPAEQDLRLVVDRELVDYREKHYAYYWLDTTDLDVGIYHVWFELAFGENLYISEKQAIQIFC